MNKLFNISPEEKQQILEMYGVSKPIINEQSLTPQQQIAQEILIATAGNGTDPDKFVNAINKIKNMTDFILVDDYLKSTQIQKFSIVELINYEMESDNAPDILKIQQHLTSIGIKSNSSVIKGVGGNGDYFNGKFVITTDIRKIQKDEGRKKNISATYCSVINGIIPVVGNVKNMKWDDYVKKYTVTAEELKYSQSVCPNRDKTINGGKPKAVTGKLRFKPNEKFPLHFLDSGVLVRTLQSLIGLKKTSGQFYTVTEKLLVDKLSKLGIKYDRKTGVTQEMFTKLQGDEKTTQPTSVQSYDSELSPELRDQNITPFV